MADACLNCGAPFAASQKFCGACGQRTGLRSQLTMRDIGRDLVHAITHADHSIFALIRALLTRPGHVARDYVEGRRKRHFGPFAFLLISVGIASAVILAFGVEWFAPYKHGHADEVLQRHVNLVILLQMPLLAVSCALLFRGDHRTTLANHLVLAAYTSGSRALFTGLVETPVLALISGATALPWPAIVFFCLWFAYFAFAASQFYRGNRLWAACKAVVAAAVSQAVAIALIMAVLLLMTRMA